MENESKCKLSRLRLRNNTAKKNDSKPESSQISKYFTRNRGVTQIITIHDADQYSETRKSNSRVEKLKAKPSSSSFADIEDENEFGETEPPQCFDDSALHLKIPAHKLRSNNLDLKTSTRSRGRPKKGSTKLDRKQPKIKNALKKQSSFEEYEEKYSNIVKQQLLADNFNPDDLQLAIALSNSISEQCNSRDTEDCFPDTQERMRNIKTTLEQFGFKNSKSVSSESSISSRQRLRDVRNGSLLLSRKQSDREKIIENNVANILKDEPIDNIPVESAKHKLVCKDLLKLASNNLILDIHKSILGDMSVYSTQLIDVDFSNTGMLLKNWSAIPGRDDSPERKSCKSDNIEQIKSADHKKMLISENKRSPRMVQQKNDSSLGKSFSNYTKVVKAKNKVILDTNIMDTSLEFLEKKQELFSIESDQNYVPTINDSIFDELLSSAKSNKLVSNLNRKTPDKKILEKIDYEENESKSSKLIKKELTVSANTRRCISPNLFESSDEDEIIESSLVDNTEISQKINDAPENTTIPPESPEFFLLNPTENTEANKRNNPENNELLKVNTSSESTSIDSMELRANANVDYDIPRNKNIFNITLDRYLRDIQKVKKPLIPELDVMDETIPNLSDFSDDSLILCEQSPTESNSSASPKGKKYGLDYNKLGKSYLRITRKKISNPKLKETKRDDKNLKSVSQMEKEFLEHSLYTSPDDNQAPAVPKQLKINISQFEKSLCDEKSFPDVKLKRTSAVRNIFKKRSVSPINQGSSILDNDTLNISEILAKNFYGCKNNESALSRKISKQTKYGLSLSQKSDTTKLRRTKSSSISPDSMRARDKLLEWSQYSDSDLITSSLPQESSRKKSKNVSISLCESDDNEEIINSLNIEITPNISDNPNKEILEDLYSSPTHSDKKFTKNGEICLSGNDEITVVDEFVDSESIITDMSYTQNRPNKIKGRASYKTPITKNAELSESSISSSPEEIKSKNLILQKDIKITETMHLYPKVICINENDDQLSVSSDGNEPLMFKKSQKTPSEQFKLSQCTTSSERTNKDVNDTICLSDNEDDLQFINPPISTSLARKSKLENNLKASHLKTIFSDAMKEIFAGQDNEADLIVKENLNSFKFSSTLNKSKLENDIVNLSQLKDAPLENSKSHEKTPSAKRSLLENFDDPNLETFYLSDDDEFVSSQYDIVMNEENDILNTTQNKMNSSQEDRLVLSDEEDDIEKKLSQNSVIEKSDDVKNTSQDKSGSDDDVLIISDEELNYSISTPYKFRNKFLPDRKSCADTPIEKSSPRKSLNFDESFIAGSSKQNNLEQDSCSSIDEMRNYFPSDSEDLVVENIDTQGSSKPNIINASIDNTDATPPKANIKKTLNVSLVNILESPKYSIFLQSGGKPKPKRLTQLKGTPGPSTSNNISGTPKYSKEGVDFNTTDDELNQLCEEVRLSYIENFKETPESEQSLFNETPRREKDPFIASPNTPTVLIIPDDCPYEVRKHNVTPKPDFDRMKTPDRLEMLNKYGLKTLKRKQANEILEYIYDQTHPIGQITPEKKKRRVETKSKESDLISDDENDVLMPDYFEAGNKKNVDGKELNGFKAEKENEEYYLPTSRSSKFLGCAVPLHISFFNYVTEKPDIREQMLRYEPIDLDEIHVGLKEQGYRYDPKDLLSFMDKRCITVKTKNRPRKEKQYGNTQSQRRKRKNKRQIKESAVCMESVESDLVLCSQMSNKESAFAKKTSTSSVDSLKDWHHEKRFKPIEISDSE